MVAEIGLLHFDKTENPRATGDLWQPGGKVPVTVPVPMPVVVVRIEGDFTALDRKLWLALVRKAWDDLDKPGHIHEIAIADVIDLFRKVSGRRDLGGTGALQLAKNAEEPTEAARLWDSVRRLAKPTIEWEDKDYMGINTLLGARMHRLFSFITGNSRGKPLVGHQVIVQLIAATTTDTGLTVRCELDQNTYPAGVKVSKAEIKAVNLHPPYLPRRVELYCQLKGTRPGAIAPGRPLSMIFTVPT